MCALERHWPKGNWVKISIMLSCHCDKVKKVKLLSAGRNRKHQSETLHSIPELKLTISFCKLNWFFICLSRILTACCLGWLWFGACVCVVCGLRWDQCWCPDIFLLDLCGSRWLHLDTPMPGQVTKKYNANWQCYETLIAKSMNCLCRWCYVTYPQTYLSVDVTQFESSAISAILFGLTYPSIAYSWSLFRKASKQFSPKGLWSIFVFFSFGSSTHADSAFSLWFLFNPFEFKFSTPRFECVLNVLTSDFAPCWWFSDFQFSQCPILEWNSK